MINPKLKNKHVLD